MQPASPDVLWNRFLTSRDPVARAALIEEHQGLVHHVARELSRRMPAHIDVDELVSSGNVGLIRALDAFDPDKAGSFSTYAVPRIRGAIIDDLRSRDPASRRIRRLERQVRDAESLLTQSLGRAPTDAEVAEKAEMEVEELHLLRREIEQTRAVSLHQPASGEDPDAGSLEEALEDPDAESADEALLREAEREELRAALAELPPRDMLVLALYYYEGRNLKEIGTVLGVSESRVSQIRSRVLKELRQRLSE